MMHETNVAVCTVVSISSGTNARRQQAAASRRTVIAAGQAEEGLPLRGEAIALEALGGASQVLKDSSW